MTCDLHFIRNKRILMSIICAVTPAVSKSRCLMIIPWHKRLARHSYHTHFLAHKTGGYPSWHVCLRSRIELNPFHKSQHSFTAALVFWYSRSLQSSMQLRVSVLGPHQHFVTGTDGSVQSTVKGQNIWAVKGQCPKISVVNDQTAEESQSKFWPMVAAVTIESMGVTPPWVLMFPWTVHHTNGTWSLLHCQRYTGTVLAHHPPSQLSLR